MSSQNSVDLNAPMACTLGPQDLQLRFAAISELARRALLSYGQVGLTLRLRYAASAAADLERLVALEQDCCTFLRFNLVRQADAVGLDITAPAEAGEFAPMLYSHFVGDARAAVAPQIEGSCPCACTLVASACGSQPVEAKC